MQLYWRMKLLHFYLFLLSVQTFQFRMSAQQAPAVVYVKDNATGDSSRLRQGEVVAFSESTSDSLVKARVKALLADKMVLQKRNSSDTFTKSYDSFYTFSKLNIDPKTDKKRKILGWSLFSSGVVFLGAAALTTMARKKGDYCNVHPDLCEDGYPIFEQKRTPVGLYILGGGFVVGGIIPLSIRRASYNKYRWFTQPSFNVIETKPYEQKQ